MDTKSPKIGKATAVNGRENKTDKVISQGKTASTFAGQHSFLTVGICWPAIYLKETIQLKEVFKS